MILSHEGKQAYKNFSQQLHQAAGVEVGEQFALSPSVLQTLHDKIVEDGNWFLGRINVMPVAEIAGQKIYMSIDGLTSTRTNTKDPNRERQPRDMMGMDDDKYMLYKTNADIGIDYSLIDMWANFPDFAQRYQRLFRQAIGNDRVRVGWHGTSVADNTDPVANPNGQDVNVGWIEKARLADNGAGNNVLSGFTMGAGGDYANLDALVSDVKHKLVDDEFKKAPGRVALISEDLIGMAEGKYYEAAGDKASEKVHMDGGRILQTYGGLPALVPPFFPDGTVIVTPLSNLSIYFQRSSWRRKLQDKPEKDQYQDFNSRNEGYIVQHMGAMGVMENITAVGSSTTPPASTSGSTTTS